MQRGLGTTEFAPQEQRRDREFTLGPVVLSVLGVGLLALCALCFVSGYAVGRHSAPEGAQTSATKDAPSAAQLFSQQPKPSAVQGSAQPATQSAMEAAQAGTAGVETPPNAGAGSATPQPAVVPAVLPAQSASGEPAVANQPAVHAAIPQSAPGAAQWVVQITMTPSQKDAELMADDLRAKGVTVSLRRDHSSNLIYVQAGPFATHDEAAAMRQKVAAAGYNAIIQP